MESNASDAEMEADTSAEISRLDVNEDESKGAGQEGVKVPRGLRAAGGGGAVEKVKRKTGAAAQVRQVSEDEDPEQVVHSLIGEQNMLFF